MRDVHYKGPQVAPPEQPTHINVKKFKPSNDPEVAIVENPVPKVKLKEPRRSACLQNCSTMDNNNNKVIQQLEALNTSSTIWAPSSLLKKRKQWLLTNTVVAIPHGAFAKEIPKPSSGGQGETLIADTHAEHMRKYHEHLHHLDKLTGLSDIEHNWRIGCI